MSFDDDDDWDDYPEYDDEYDESIVLPCPNCGGEVYEDAEQCPSCGEYVSLISSSPIEEMSGAMRLIGRLGILAVILGLLGYFLLF